MECAIGQWKSRRLVGSGIETYHPGHSDTRYWHRVAHQRVSPTRYLGSAGLAAMHHIIVRAER